MKKLIQTNVMLLALAAAVLFSSPASVFAASPMLVKGKVTKPGNVAAAGATVVVSCRHNNISYTRVATTDAGGNYSVIYANEPPQCLPGDQITVTVFKDDFSGANQANAPVSNNATINVKIFETQAIPEFGMISGAAALLTSAGAFYAMRKRG
jgi:hypothetical protein